MLSARGWLLDGAVVGLGASWLLTAVGKPPIFILPLPPHTLFSHFPQSVLSVAVLGMGEDGSTDAER